VETLPQVITIGGAAGVLWYVLNLLVSGKLHTNSEVEGLRADIVEYRKTNHALTEALRVSNVQQRDILTLLREGPGK
jgi:hypothetical protein